MRPHESLPHVPRPLARRMAAFGLDLTAVARSEPRMFGDLRNRCSACRHLDRCASDLKADSAGPMRYCPNARALNFLTDVWWLRTLL
jgi:hypothetical protein